MALPTLTSSTKLDQLTPPSQDPWYTTAPSDLEAIPPGSVLKIRTVPGGPVVFNSAYAAYHILYRTTGSHYQPTWAVTSLLIPKKTFVSSSGFNALLSYQIAYNSPSIDWGPSYRIFQPAQPNPYGIPTDHEKINSMLDRGWVVAVPDFEGRRAAFGASVLAGHATIDGIRAVLALAGHAEFSLPNADNFKYAMWGYSGGSLASEKAAELQVQYAPELAPGFVGVALGGLISKAASAWAVTNKTPYAGNLALVLLGVMNEYPEFDAYLRSRLKTEGPQDADTFYKGRDMDSLLAFHAFKGQDIYEYFIGGQEAIEESEIYRKITRVEWTLGFHGCPTIPLYVYKAIGDEMAPIVDTDEHIAYYGRFGASVLYERNTAGSHVSEIVNGQERAIEWLVGAFEGSHTHQGVTVRDVTVDNYKPPAF